jgi:hypothetical protein
MGRIDRALAGVVVAALLAWPELALTQSPRSQVGLWLSGGAGVKTTQGFIDALGLHLQLGQTVVTARRSSFTLDRQPSDAVGVVVGRVVTPPGPRHVDVSFGLSRVSTTRYFDRDQVQTTRSGIGVMASADVSLRSGSSGGVGIGLTTFTHVNAFRSFGGVALEISAGKWR